MQALRVAAPFALRARVEDGALRVHQGDRLLYVSDALLQGCLEWKWDAAAEVGRLFYPFNQHPDNADIYVAHLVLCGHDVRTLTLAPCLTLHLRLAQHAALARWVARRVRVAAGEREWQRFAECLERVLQRGSAANQRSTTGQ